MTRTCIQCGEPFVGRKDKQSCSDACRSQHRRDNLTASDNWTESEEPEVYQPSSSKPSNHPPVFIKAKPIPEDDEDEDPQEDMQTYLARRRKELLEEDSNKKLDQRFRKFVNECLKADKLPFNDEDDDELQTWLNEVDELIVDYRAHSGLRMSNELTIDRLDSLHWLSDKFRRMLAKWQKQETSWLSAPEPVHFELSEKRRTLLRKYLLPQ